MQKWEYKVIYLEWNQNVYHDWMVTKVNGKEVEHERMYIYMDQLGEEGWELVSVTFNTQTMETKGTTFYQEITKYDEFYRLFFKRSKEQG